MKRVLVTIVACCYLGSSIGATITIHACMGRVFAIDFSQKDQCAKCGMKTTKGCCQDASKFLKLQDVHQPSTNLWKFTYITSTYPSDLQPHTAPASYPNQAKLINYPNSPPGPEGNQICVLHCVFRL